MSEYISLRWQEENGVWRLRLVDRALVERLRQQHRNREEDRMRVRLEYARYLYSQGHIKH